MNRVVYLDIKGMHCPNCPAKVERAVLKMDGVSQINVSWERENGCVSYDQHTTAITEIIDRVEKMGFKASIVQDGIKMK
ncbi:cation transporter [Virgibacillus siamensis]|uniref:cation transporter n=1 Tax=Virgibacillus siamensis TaxID=480071 RepID=UPI0009879F9A|nr:heavy metal-associated domain-containing protein [Virgibacillus siamensis]